MFLVITLLLIFGGSPAPPSHAAQGAFVLGPFLLAVSVSATSQAGYAVYAADYSRYLPQRTSTTKVF